MFAGVAKHLSSNLSLGEILVKMGLIGKNDLETILKKASNSNLRIGSLLVSEGYITEIQLAQSLAIQHDLPFYDLNTYNRSLQTLARVPERIAMTYCVLPIEFKNDVLTLAVQEPMDILSTDHLKKFIKDQFKFVIAPENQLKNLIRSAYSDESDSVEEFSRRLIQSVSRENPNKKTPDSVRISFFDAFEVDKNKVSEKANNIERLVQSILESALDLDVSDIHIEPKDGEVKVRHRIFGCLKDISSLPKDLHSCIISKLKVLGGLDIAEKRRPQDGSFQHHYGSRSVDFRLSIIPTLHGEKAVLRILDKTLLRCKLDQLGMDPWLMNLLQKKMNRPHGLFLVAGPTGSGKTTTVYSLMNQVASNSEKNVVSIEDPIEFQLEGVCQTAVNAKAGMTFASALRSILRQDPDVIIVGEIRDQETAEIAMRAALTGHLVISTLHSNSALGTIHRLQDIGVDPVLIGSSLIGVLSQRLVRVLCPNCRIKDAKKSEFQNLISEDKRDSVFVQGPGCHKCKGVGFSGRTAIHEMLDINEEISRFIMTKKPQHEIQEAIKRNGFIDLCDVGLQKVLDGETSIDEIIKHLSD